jgi:hypothetical protein
VRGGPNNINTGRPTAAQRESEIRTLLPLQLSLLHLFHIENAHGHRLASLGHQDLRSIAFRRELLQRLLHDLLLDHFALFAPGLV